MNKFRHIIILFIAFTAITSYAQKVSNITFRQEQSTIIVSYDLETKTPCKVSLYVSTNGGTKWQGPLTKVTGDVGNKIVSGSNNIIWSVLEEFDELKGDNIKFQVKAIGSNIETIKIGAQEWTTKNLNVSTYRNGDIIPEVKDQNEWDKLTTGAWCYYNNDPKNGPLYGKLYNWYAVNDLRGLAPEGFHIPSKTDWEILIQYLGGKKVAPGKLKSTRQLWLKPNTDANNTSGFSGLPGGARFIGFFDGVQQEGCWASKGYDWDPPLYYDENRSGWSFSSPEHNFLYKSSYYLKLLSYNYRVISYNGGNIPAEIELIYLGGSSPGKRTDGDYTLKYGMSVRCLLD